MHSQNRVTVADIAARLGLAPTTVSHVLAGRGDRLRIKQETQQRITEAAREMGYRINTSARAMRTGRIGCAALIQPLDHLYLPPPLLVGLSGELERRNMHLSLAYTLEEALLDESYLPKVVREMAADGLVINHPWQIPPSFMEAVAHLQIPCIQLNHDDASDAVHPDEYLGGRMAAEHLLSLGHREITFAIAGKPGSDRTVHFSVPARIKGCRDVLEGAGLQLRTLELPIPSSAEDNQGARIQRAQEYLQQPDCPTAILAYEIQTAIPFLVAAGRVGLSIPQDLSLIMFHGFYDITAGVQITTIWNDWEAIGVQAVEALCAKMLSPERPLPTRALPPRLLAGETCAAVARKR